MTSTGISYAHIAKSAKGPASSSNVSSNPVSSASSEQGGKSGSTQSDVQQLKTAKGSSKSEKENTPLRLSSQGSVQSDETSRVEKSSWSAESASDQLKTSEKEDITTPRDTDSFAASPKSSNEEKRLGNVNAQDLTDSQDKNKDNEEEWEKVSIPSTTAEKTEKEKELKDAPPPKVNFWTQRMQQQQAKQKEQTVRQTVVPTATQPPKGRQPSAPAEDTKKKQNSRDNNAGETTTSAKGNANAKSRDQQSNSTSPRSASQQNEKTAAQQLPPVDTESWPTPESAIVDSSRRSSAIDKLEKTDMTENKSSSKKAWQPLPFVPSVKFETQLPGTARRGGAGGARPQNGRGRGGANAHADRSAEKSDAGNMAPPPLPKTVSEQDRGRRSNANHVNRASSVPTENQRSGTTEQPTSGVGSTKPSISDQSSSVAADTTTGTSTPPTQDPSRSSSRHISAVTSSKPVVPDRDTAVGSIDTAADSSSQAASNEKTKTPITESFKNLELGEKPTNKEWQKERANNAQKSENWRNERRAGDRPDRGSRGGGSYRGNRNSHATFNSNSFTSPLPQNAFEAPKQNNPSDPRSRQPSQPFTSSPYGSTRVNPRSQSIPLQMLPGSFYPPTPGFPSTLPPIQTDMGYPGYGQMPSLPGSVMSAMPYGDQLGGFALISMVVTQLEYYFSLDNLCKDMYLRKHMDSQGFVPLRVIAEFRRIKALLGDNSVSYDQLRHVAQQVRNIEFVVGEDGEDRLRNRENWKDFVLPMEERLPQAQNDGPAIKQSRSRYSMPMPDFHMSNGLRSAPPNVNGFQENFPNPHVPQYQAGMFGEPQSHEQWALQVDAAQHDQERRTSLTSPLSKVQSPSSDMRSNIAGITNGHRDSISSSAAGKENTFPDEEVSKLKVVVRDPEYQSETDGATEEPSLARVSGLRGSAGSPEQLERFRSLQFGQNTRSSSRNGEQTAYFTQGEAPAQYMQPGYIHEEYLTLREKALSQRAENHFEGACVPLYPLWAEFLAAPSSFNVGMYEDFKTWALEDMEKGNENGKKYLVRFYDSMLGGKIPMTERLATDIVNIARSEPTNSRPVWLKLRAAWRNGATNMKTRKRLTDLLTSEEQTELERGT